MERLGSAAFLLAGLVLSGVFFGLSLVFAGAAAGNSGQTSFFAERVFPISMGVFALWLITSSVLFWRGREGWSLALAWGPGLFVLLLMIFN